MSKYGCAIDFQEAKLFDREEIEYALKGKVRVGENDKGFIYDMGTNEECRKVILDNFDEAVFCAIESLRNSRTLEQLVSRKISPDEYNDISEEERLKDYEGVYFRKVLDKAQC